MKARWRGRFSSKEIRRLAVGEGATKAEGDKGAESAVVGAEGALDSRHCRMFL